MLNHRLTAALAVRDAYLPLKRQSNALALQAARCVLVMQEQRAASGMRIGTGAEAIADVSQGAALIAQGMAKIAVAHPKFAELIKEVGLQRFYPYDYGAEDTPPNGSTTGNHATPALRVVGD